VSRSVAPHRLWRLRALEVALTFLRQERRASVEEKAAACFQIIPDRSEAAEGSGKFLNVMQQQCAFIECFREELFGERTLLLSQLNNLYTMRSGEELPYKLSGYDKLRDFLQDIPGLKLVGRGNQMQVQLENPAELEVFQKKQQESQQDDHGHTPQFRMPKSLPASLLQQLHELFTCADRYEIRIRNFDNVWHMHFPSAQINYRALGFRNVRGLLSQVPFIEKVGRKHDAKYVLKHMETSQLRPSVPVPTDRLHTGVQDMMDLSPRRPPLVAPPARAQSGYQDMRQAGPHTMAQADRLQSGYQEMHPQRWPQTIALSDQMQGGFQEMQRPTMPQMPHGMGQPDRMQTELQAKYMMGPQGLPMTTVPGADSKETFFNGQLAGLGGRPQGMPQTFQEADFPEGTTRMARPVREPAHPTTEAPYPRYTHPAMPPAADRGKAAPAANGMNEWQLGMPSGTPLPEAAAWTVPPENTGGRMRIGPLGSSLTPSGTQRPLMHTPTDPPGSAPTPWGPQPPLMHTATDPRVLHPPGAVDRDMDLNAARSGDGCYSSSSKVPCAFETWDPLSGSVMDLPPPCHYGYVAGPTRSSGRGGPQDIGGNPFTGCQGFPSNDGIREVQSSNTATIRSAGSSLEPPPTQMETAEPPAVQVDDYQAVPHAAPDTASAAPRRPKKQKNASFFVSSPGAISSDTRDASVQQGRFDMASVLQMQLSQDTPCLVCDLSGGTVMITNVECEELFQTQGTSRRLCQSDIASLVHEDDRDQFSTCLAYQMVSERTHMDPLEIRIVTGLGRARLVRIDGIQLIGLWWQLRFSPLDEPAAPR